jgi:hypothetical protein
LPGVSQTAGIFHGNQPVVQKNRPSGGDAVRTLYEFLNSLRGFRQSKALACENWLMGERACRYCQKAFLPSKFQPAQTACSDPACQRRRRSDYHRRKVAADPVYRQGCLESAQQWRAEHPDYWRQLLEQNPARAERNRQRQRKRDERRRQRRLANNNSAPNLANNSPAIPQITESKAPNLANNSPMVKGLPSAP